MDRLAAETLELVRSRTEPSKTPPDCICHACIQEHDIRSTPMPFARLQASMMIVCPVCGNKRCPRASDHRNKCTNSNRPGQEGSVYK